MDTFTLMIDQNKFHIIDHDSFSPSSRDLAYSKVGVKGYISYYLNPTEKQKREHGYLPYLTLTKRIQNGGISISLKIQFSAPKLIYGNNFDELFCTKEEFYTLIVILKKQLLILGVDISESDLISAKVTSVHYSKNFVFINGIHPIHILEEIKKCNISKIYDFSKESYRSGHAIKAHTNSSEIIFYDKMEDLRKSRVSEKRSIENDNKVQIHLLDPLNKKRLEVLRMEYRLNTSRLIKDTLAKLNKDFPPTFNNLYNKELSKEILIYRWELIANAYPLQIRNDNSVDQVTNLLFSYQDIRLDTILEIIGYTEIVRVIGARGFREILQKYDSRKVNRLVKKVNSYTMNLQKPNIFKEIRIQLEEFKTVKLVDYNIHI